MGIGYCIVILAVAALAGLCVRNIINEHKGGSCGGCKGCQGGSCGGCGGQNDSEYIITIKKKRQKLPSAPDRQ
ncbi:MAG: FeoB-associated Cys-rich membrane protein [Eubacterium sp.]|nr:FeoB-associated Cys-rich membrane protein [Eubacterium sp.]